MDLPTYTGGNKLSKDYRKDWRSEEQFAKDIAQAHRVEKTIILTYADHLREKYGMEVTVEDNGVDNDGSLLDSKKVNTNADYRVNGKLIEVKYNNPYMSEFRFKKSQLFSYLKQGAYVLWVNGWETEHPEFTLIKTKKLKWIVHNKKEFAYQYWGYKLCYNLDINDFEWQQFEGMHK